MQSWSLFVAPYMRCPQAARLVKLLESKRGEVDALNDRARGVEGRFIRQLLKPPMDMLLAALVRWEGCRVLIVHGNYVLFVFGWRHIPHGHAAGRAGQVGQVSHVCVVAQVWSLSRAQPLTCCWPRWSGGERTV